MLEILMMVIWVLVALVLIASIALFNSLNKFVTTKRKRIDVDADAVGNLITELLERDKEDRQ